MAQVIWALSPFSWNTASVETKSELKVKSLLLTNDKREPLVPYLSL
jgi:hypothetical protein